MKIKAMVFILLIGISLFPISVSAQNDVYGDLPDVLNEIQITDNRATFTFSDLGISERNLLGPLSETTIFFSVPPNWQLTSGSTIQLQFEVLMSGLGERAVENVSYVAGANITVEFNNVLIGIVTIDRSGSYAQVFSIPSEALASPRADGRHAITIGLDAQLGCNYDLNTSVKVKLTSVVDLFYQQGSPNLDLSRLPAPFYLNNSIVNDSTLVVVQDNPDPIELQAALNVISGFGAMINNNYNIQLITYSTLTESLRAQNHLIFIGLLDSFDILSNVNFQTSTNNTQTSSLLEGDGVLQLALSPWNQSKVVLLVSGNSLESLSKAAYALSTGNILIYQNPEIAYISNVQFLPADIPVVEQFTLEDIGYATITLDGVGGQSEEFTFYVSKSQIVSNNAYIELIYNHSGLGDYSASAFSLYLNGNVFFTKLLSKETEQVTTLQVRIPPGFLRHGENVLELDVDLLVGQGCDAGAFVEPWFTISNQSLFFVPSSEVPLSQTLLRDLKFYPELFTITSDLSEITFVVPEANTESWRTAAQISYRLGQTVQPGISNIQVAYGNDLSENTKQNQSMIIIGKPSDLPFISEINDFLPAPFDLETNTASERQLMISYRIPDGQSVGYLELLQSPFNSEKTILFVSGNSDLGVQLAGDTLIFTNLQDQLAGVFAVTNGTQIATGSASSSFSVIGEGVPGSQQVSEIPISSQTLPRDIETPVWVLPFIVSTSITILVVSILVFRRFLMRDRLRKMHENIFEEMVDEQTEEDQEDKN
ncbi:MAG: cellulose biosynthesis cyclic di-GMP-binding regulatory protein BcsB [Anaerolineales bacterium]|nr:cellulose biosynthesis cyclic di-GMP-binding regulatory protein BcsB [Anaerolineales bacterium]